MPRRRPTDNVVLSVVPGFLALAAWSRGRAAQPPRSDARLVIHSVALSFVVQTFLAPVTLALIYPYRDHLDRHSIQVVGWTFVAAVAVPTLGGYVLGCIAEALTRDAAIDPTTPLRRFRADLRPRPPTAFDWLVETSGLPDPSIVVVTFRDGRRVAGLNAVGACLTRSPQLQGMFLPVEMQLDERGEPTGRSVANSLGVLVPDLTDVRSIRLIGYEESQ